MSFKNLFLAVVIDKEMTVLTRLLKQRTAAKTYQHAAADPLIKILVASSAGCQPAPKA